MNLHVTRIRLSSVGPEPARFDPLDLNLTNSDGGGPADTVLFLPNTGGKTVLLRLLFSVLHPPIVERIGSEEAARRGRNLAGYILERDTAHIVVEWRRAENGRFVGDEVLLTGLAAEWRGGRPTGNPSDLIRMWYSIRGGADVVSIDGLVFDVDDANSETHARRRVPLRQFRESLSELGTSRRRGGIEVTTTEVQRDWVEHLDALGLDRALFRYQGEMNHNEAGASAIARFTKDLDFVGFFLNAVVDPSELSVLDREFDEVAEKVRRFPEYQVRVRFGEAALGELEPLALLVEQATHARIEAASARRNTLTLLAAFAGGTLRARQHQHAEHERYRQRDSDARGLATLAERSRDEAREYRRLAAQFWCDEVNQTYNAALDKLTRCELDQRAWIIAEDVIRCREAAAEVRVLDAEYAAEIQRLKPFQQSRDEAARELALRLMADAVLAETLRRSEERRAAEAKQRAQQHRKEDRDALVEAARLDASRQNSEAKLAEIQAHRERIVALGYLEAGEAADVARDRERARSQEALERVDAIATELRALEAERNVLDSEEGSAAIRRRQLQQQHDVASSEIEQATSERARLAAEPVVVELAESVSFDLELVGPSIAQRLHGRAAEADKARIDLQVRGIEDRRALNSLDATGLLPPPHDVTAALQRLADAGITGAIAGTRYVAEAISADNRDRVVACRADLVGGIVLTDDANLEIARSVLRSAALDPTMIISVGSATELVRAETSEEGGQFVIPPAASVWDRTAAGSERVRREARVASLDDEHALLDARATGSRSLAEALSRHAASYPVGWLAARSAERSAAAGEIARLDSESKRREARRHAISESVQRGAADRDALQLQARESDRKAAALGHLADDEANTAPLTETITKLRNAAHEWQLVAVTAGRMASLDDDEATDASTNAHNQSAAAGRLRQELLNIPLADPIQAPSLEAAQTIAHADNLEELRLRFAERERRLLGETSSSEVAARRAVAIRTRDRLRESVESRPIEVRTRVDFLLRLPGADDAMGRRAAAERADAELAASRTAEREEYAIRVQAQRDLSIVEEEIKTSRRTVKLGDDQTPRDRHQAARFAATARQNADSYQGQAAAAERERAAAREASDAAKTLAEALTNLSTPLEMALNNPASTENLPSVTPYEGGVDEARKIGVDTLRRLTDAIAAEDKTERAWRARDTALRTVLQQDEFANLSTSDRLYRRLSQSSTETLARDSAELVAELRTSIGILRSELETMSEDVRLATMSLAKGVNKAVSLLRLAETRSRMPKSLRDWADAPFLTIKFDKPPAEQLEARLATFVTEVISRPTNRPTGTTLLLQALERAVGQFSVQILKPNEGFALIRVPVTELSSQTFSNGQRSTVATALMLMLSELRRQSRGAARDASVGTLLLDNPFGNANAGFLIEVQRTVAAASGIQLVYSTGIADFNALRHFPNVIALSNDAARRTMRRYVRANPELLQMLIPANSGANGGRLSATRVVAVVDNDGHVRG